MKKRNLICATLVLICIWGLQAAALAPSPAATGTPTAADREAETYIGIQIEVPLSAYSADSEIVLYQLTEQPRLGTAHIDGSKLIYLPGSKAGRDTFGYVAMDAAGRISQPAQVRIRVTKNKAGLTYADMEDNPAHFAALQLAARHVFAGEQVGTLSFFRPALSVSRSDFVSMAAALAELPLANTEVTDFVDDDGISPCNKPSISAAAACGLISGYPTAGGMAFYGDRTISVAEASVIAENLLAQRDTDVAAASIQQHSADTDWRAAAVSRLCSAGLLDHSLSADPTAPLTREQACLLLYRLLG